MITQSNTKVLVVDDDKIVLRAVQEILQMDGYQVVAIDDAVEALAALKDASIDVAVFDIKMPNFSGMELLQAIKQARSDVEVLMMTAYGTVETAVEAVKMGAYDYLTKPFEDIDVLLMSVRRAAEKKALYDRTRELEKALNARDQFENLVGQSQQMRQVFKLVETVSHSTATVLIQGESGTGKELVAQAIHYRSPRKGKPFVAVNCSALTDTLLESELFGHIRGAFTGATGNKKGLFEAADGGTIFLDEIGDISAATQVRLLRVLQEGEVKRVGANESTRVDVRVIAASNVDLQRAKEQGKFREDLFYRLNVIPITLPPLRDRPEDVPLLVHHFLKIYSGKLRKEMVKVSPKAMEALTCNRWEGNVRELENVIERALVLCSKEVVDVEDLPREVLRVQKAAGEFEVFSLAHLPYAQAKRLARDAFERRYLSVLLERSGNNISLAARTAEVDRSNFRRLLKQHGILSKPNKVPENSRLQEGFEVGGVEDIEASNLSRTGFLRS
ncbi:MAG: sigma-54 dependent transcriptional regulator [Proteobacteria bacterium]|nr:sigma-54 dependent transcriptional regulator [Cystobacterineae bacterium]MCL2259286.1 sigma-54 dependent transcriptional regulator [Cystobacterineae bacterium]MCL2314314.1 sigma-54 dependent transcriptional regulator [Pseudomonadota bacterium]